MERITSLNCSHPTPEVILLMAHHDRTVEQHALEAVAYACPVKNDGIDPLVDAIQKSK